MATGVLEAVDTFAQQKATLVQTYVRQVWNIWKSLTPADWWNDAVTLGAAAQAARFEIAFLESVARLGVSYADAMLAIGGVTGRGEDLTAWVAPRLETTPLDVMLRPVNAYRHEAVQLPSLRPASWSELEGASLDSVTGWLRAALDRLQDIAETDAALTANRVVMDRYEQSDSKMCRRVIHPELSKTGTCGLCVVASTRVYYTDELLPMHSNCKCGIAPITSYKDVGRDISDEDLKKYYKMAGSTSGRDLKELRFRVEYNGELGPVLRSEAEKSGRTVVDWTPPDRVSTRRQAAHIVRSYSTFEAMYREVMQTGKEVSRRVDGRTVKFKPGVHNAQARNYYRDFIQQLRDQFPGL